MSSLPLHIILLIAVAYSQIFGGVSCCCLPRVLALNWTIASTPSSLLSHEMGVASNRPTPKCPKCFASVAPRETATSANSAKGLAEAVPLNRSGCFSGDNQCRCDKVAANAGVHTEPLSLSIAPQAVSLGTTYWSLALLLSTQVLLHYPVPIRFSGHSWQAIACVWKN